ARQELRKSHQIGVTGFAEPSASDNKLIAEIAKMCNWPAKRGQSQLREDEQNGPGRRGSWLFFLHPGIRQRHHRSIFRFQGQFRSPALRTADHRQRTMNRSAMATI